METNNLIKGFMRKKGIWQGLSCLLLLVSIACSPKKAQNETGETQVKNQSNAIDTMRLYLNIAEIDTMSVNFSVNNDWHELKVSDRNRFGELISFAVNDTAWSNSNIMVKMVAPDYIVMSHFKNKSQDENAWISIWKELGKAKYNNKWYLLPDKKDQIYQILDMYKK